MIKLKKKKFSTKIRSNYLSISCEAYLAKKDYFSCFEIYCFFFWIARISKDLTYRYQVSLK